MAVRFSVFAEIEAAIGNRDRNGTRLAGRHDPGTDAPPPSGELW